MQSNGAMKIFIAWSGPNSRSQLLAGHLKVWLETIAERDVEVFISVHIEAGENWASILRRQIEAADAIIVCMTPENRASPWMHFEAGAVWGLKGGSVFPYVLGMPTGQISSPLAHIQAKSASFEGTRELFSSILRQRTAPGWEQRFSDLRPIIERDLDDLASPSIEAIVPNFGQLFDGHMTFEEDLILCQNRNWKARFARVCANDAILTRIEQEVSLALPPHVHQLFSELREELRRYQTALEVLIEDKYQRPDVLPRDVVDSAEPARKTIRTLVAQLKNPPPVPLIGNSTAWFTIGLGN